MKDNIEHYGLFAAIFDYPQANYIKHCTDLQNFLDKMYPEAANEIRPFSEFMSMANLIKQQELFVRSFDVQAVTTLDLGYVMFGDDYKRGELLVNLNREHREVNNDCGVELSDHMPNVLRLLPLMQDQLIIDELVKQIIAPSLQRMIRGFAPEEIKLKDKFYKRKHKTIIDRPDAYYTLYQQALEALLSVLKIDFEFEEEELREKTSDFLRNITTEEKIEG